MKVTDMGIRGKEKRGTDSTKEPDGGRGQEVKVISTGKLT